MTIFIWSPFIFKAIPFLINNWMHVLTDAMEWVIFVYFQPIWPVCPNIDLVLKLRSYLLEKVNNARLIVNYIFVTSEATRKRFSRMTNTGRNIW